MLEKDQTIRIRQLGPHGPGDWVFGIVIIASETAAAIQLHELMPIVGLLGGSKAKVLVNVLPVSIDAEAETVTGLWGEQYEIEVGMTKDERDLIVATLIKQGRCPFEKLGPGQNMSQCPLGFPGCGCGDEMMLNSYLNGKPRPVYKTFASFEAYCLRHSTRITVRHKGKDVSLAALPEATRQFWIHKWFEEQKPND